MSVHDFSFSPLCDRYFLTYTISRFPNFSTNCFPPLILHRNLSLRNRLSSKLSFSKTVEESNSKCRQNRLQFLTRSSDGEISGLEDELVEGEEEEEEEEEGVESVYTDDEDNTDSFDIEELERQARDAARQYSFSLSQELTIGIPLQ